MRLVLFIKMQKLLSFLNQHKFKKKSVSAVYFL